jgi:hypothetical protein
VSERTTGGERLRLAAAVLLGGFGFVMVAGVTIGLSEGDREYSPATNLLLAVLLGVAPMGVAAWLARGVRRAVSSRSQAAREAAILALAPRRGGALRPADVAAATGMSLDQARECLDRLHLRGFCRLDLSDTGTELFRFR